MKSHPRCHLDSQQERCALCEIPAYLRQLTYAHTSQYNRNPFRCALSGPFIQSACHPVPSIPDSLWGQGCFYFRVNGFFKFCIIIAPLEVPVKKNLGRNSTYGCIAGAEGKTCPLRFCAAAGRGSVPEILRPAEPGIRFPGIFASKRRPGPERPHHRAWFPRT